MGRIANGESATEGELICYREKSVTIGEPIVKETTVTNDAGRRRLDFFRNTRNSVLAAGLRCVMLLGDNKSDTSRRPVYDVHHCTFPQAALMFFCRPSSNFEIGAAIFIDRNHS